MDPITMAVAFGALTLIGATVKSPATEVSTPDSDRMKEIETQVLERLKDASKITIPAMDTWVEVKHGNETWLVAPRYIAPSGIGEGLRIAKAQGFELPSPSLVDSIYKAADLKLDPHPRGTYYKPPSDFTGKTMNSPETHIAQLAYIQNQIEAANPNYKLLAGTHKDIVMGTIPGGFKDAGTKHVGIYGWHKRDGKPIQGFMWGHASGNTPDSDWKDYSQGLRLVKRIG